MGQRSVCAVLVQVCTESPLPFTLISFHGIHASVLLMRCTDFLNVKISLWVRDE